MEISGKYGSDTKSISTDKNGNLIVSNTSSKYQNSVLAGNVFFAASQAATTWSVALNTTHTGLVVSNPVSSNKNLVILKASFALSVAPAAIAHIGLFIGYTGTGIITHTTALTVYNSFIGAGSATKAFADGAATLVGTPVWNQPIMGGFTAGALPSTSPAIIDVDGSIIVPPGGYCGIGALTAVVGFGSLTWEEQPI